MSLIPDIILGSYADLTVSFLKERDIRALVLDVDNTLIPYEETEPPAAVRAWLEELKAAGISVAFVSNNHRPRLETFNATLGYPAYAHGCKPLCGKIKKALRAMGADPAHTANMGDQIFTDVLAGKRMGFYTILVPPIKDKRDIFTRFKRWLEKPFVKRYYKRKEKEEQK